MSIDTRHIKPGIVLDSSVDEPDEDQLQQINDIAVRKHHPENICSTPEHKLLSPFIYCFVLVGAA